MAGEVLFEKVLVKYPKGDGTSETVEGYKIAPGLAVNPALIKALELDQGWNITHLRSGTRLNGGSLPFEEAVKKAQEFAALGNWDIPLSKWADVSAAGIDGQAAKRILGL